MATKTKSLMPAFITHLFSALAHICKGIDVGAEMFEDTMVTT